MLAEDRAKLVKSKKLAPLMRKCKEMDVIILECDRCCAFFIHNDDFERHKKMHTIEQPAGETETQSLAGAVPCSSVRAILPENGVDHQNSKVKIGSDSKKIATKKSQIRDLHTSARGSKSTTKKISQNSSDLKGNPVTQKLKRKLNTAQPAETKGVTEDSCPTKKRKCAEGSDVVSAAQCHSPSTKKCATPGSIPVAHFAERANGSGDPKSAQLKKTHARRLRRNDDDEKGEEQFVCAHCLRSFRRKSNLKRHMVKLHFTTKKSAVTLSSKWFTGYCCDVCGEGLQHRATMMAHRDVLHGAHPEMDWVKYRTSLARVKFCADCKKYFRCGGPFETHDCDRGDSLKDAHLAQRVRSAEEAPPKFVCSVCRNVFRWKWDYRLHYETEHSDAAAIDWTTVIGAVIPHLCEPCSKAYASADELAAHTCAAELRQQPALGDQTKKQYRCAHCDHEYFWKSDYKRHLRTKHPKEHHRPTEHDTIVYTCPYCADKFTLKKGILLHMRKAHKVNSDSPFVCVKCNKVFRRRDNMDRHNESYHPALGDAEEVHRILGDAEIRINGDLTYRCAVCNRNIANADRFIAHYRGHSAQYKFKCDLCDKQTRTQHQLNTHIKNIHLNIRNYRCDFCEKSFYTKQACEEHRRTHTGERPFSCEICGKTFVAGNALISHKRFHNDFYPYSCLLCDKKFKVRRSLVNHVRTHTGERPFECDLCAKTFNNSSQYSYHKRVTHSEERRFTCEVCGNRFKTNKFLTRHMELHSSSRSLAQPRKAKRDGASTEVVVVGDTSVGGAVAKRGIEMFVSAPAVGAVPPAGGPSIVNVVSTRSATILEGANPVDCADIRDENILPRPNPYAQSEYRCGVKSSRDSNESEYMTTLEFIQVADGEYKRVGAGETYIALQPDNGHGAAVKTSTWL